jgi:hypothetical protein
MAAALVSVYGSSLCAEEVMRQHGAHVHGSAKLNIALEGNQLTVELISPAVNIVGFEYAPANDQQEKAVADATTVLGDGSKVFGFPSEAGCQPAKADVETEMFAEEHEHEEEHAKEEGHAEKAHSGEETETETHAEFHVTYAFVCTDAGRLDHIDVLLFETFPGTKNVDAQVIGPKGQTAVELNPDSPRLSL